MGNVEKVTFSVAILLFDMKMHSDSTTKKFYRSRSFGDLVQRSLISCLSTFSKDFSTDTNGLYLNFICSPQAKEERRFIYLV